MSRHNQDHATELTAIRRAVRDMDGDLTAISEAVAIIEQHVYIQATIYGPLYDEQPELYAQEAMLFFGCLANVASRYANALLPDGCPQCGQPEELRGARG